jgi:hypothetical protein
MSITDNVPTEATEPAGTTSETITDGMVADPLKEGVPLFLQTQNRDGAKPLLIFEVAKHAIAAATTAEEVKDIRDKALGLAAYAREANDRQLEAEAVEIRARASRRLGEMIEAQKATVGLNTGTAGMGRPPSLGGSADNPPKPDDRPTLASQEINKALAHEARTLAKMPEEKFEQDVAAKVAAIRARRRKPRNTMSTAERKERDRKLTERKQARREQERLEHYPDVIHCMCERVRLVSIPTDDDMGLGIPPDLTTEVAAELVRKVEGAIKNLKKLEAALFEIADGGDSARRVH